MNFFEHLANLPYCVVKGCQSRNTTCAGKPHNCRKCGAKNLHRMQDCEISRELGQNAMCFLELSKIPPMPSSQANTGKHQSQKTVVTNGALATTNVTADIAGAYVVKRNGSDLYLLIQQRADWLNGKLSTPGGEVNAGESAKDAAVRELWEESGLRGNLSFVRYFEKSTLNSGKTVVPLLFEYSGSWTFEKGLCSGECGGFRETCFGNVRQASFGHAWVKLTSLPYGFSQPNADKFLGKIPVKTIAAMRKHYGV